jgi:GT2 family glycosyltransferase
MLTLVSATRCSKDEFAQKPLGLSLRRMSFDRTMELHVIIGNQQGLPKSFNQFISEKYRDHELVFLHDDLWLDDLFFSDRIRMALQNFDVVGLAGNRRLLPGAPAWHVKDERMEWDHGNLSGVVCHGPQPFGTVSIYGSTPAPVQLLDGVLLAARCSALLDAGVRFDERFDFHFYDLDFSRQANAAGLKVGTWPIAVTHVSGGNFGSPGWRKNLDLYWGKWGRA